MEGHTELSPQTKMEAHTETWLDKTDRLSKVFTMLRTCKVCQFYKEGIMVCSEWESKCVDEKLKGQKPTERECQSSNIIHAS